MRNPNADGQTYTKVTNLFADGDLFGYVDNDHFVVIAPGENMAYLVDSQNVISSTNQQISSAYAEEITAAINAVYPSVGYLTYKIKNFSVGDEVNIGGEI